MSNMGYTILGTQPYTYLDDMGRVTNGYRVTFRMDEFGETAFVDVPSLAPQVVQPKIAQIVKDRKALSG
jgi:hypothetical protein